MKDTKDNLFAGMFGFSPMKLFKWAFGLIILLLKSPIFNFMIKIPEAELVNLIGEIAKDGFLSDDELARLLEYIKKYIFEKR